MLGAANSVKKKGAGRRVNDDLLRNLQVNTQIWVSPVIFMYDWGQKAVVFLYMQTNRQMYSSDRLQ